LPLACRLYSTLEKNFKSQNDERHKLIAHIVQTIGNSSVYVMDRGFSGIKMLKFLVHKVLFVCRAIDRKVEVNGQKVMLMTWAKEIKLPYYKELRRWRNGKCQKINSAFGVHTVHFDQTDYQAVVMQIDGHGVCVLLSNQPRKGLSEYDYGSKIIHQYGLRWKVEEVFRYQKQQYEFENVRVRSLHQLRNLIMIGTLVSAFAAFFQGFTDRTTGMASEVFELARGIRVNIGFRLYRMGEGLKILFRRVHWKPFDFPHHRHSWCQDSQLFFNGL
jgi:hypothetical protein